MSIKIPTTENPVSKFITHRWSPRSFVDKNISNKDIATILEAASWAPSAMNEQPWRYIVALKDNKEAFEKLASLLVPGNLIWAKNASALILPYTKTTYSQDGSPNSSALHDTGMANQNLLLQALELGIYGHVMGGYDQQKARAEFNLGEEYQPICVIALGYPGSPEQLIEPFKTRELTPRKRKGLEEFVQVL